MSILRDLPEELLSMITEHTSAQGLNTLGSMNVVNISDMVDKILEKYYPYAITLYEKFHQQYPRSSFDKSELLGQIEQMHPEGVEAPIGALAKWNLEKKDPYPLVNTRLMYNKYFGKENDKPDVRDVLFAAVSNDDLAIIRLILAQPGMRTEENLWQLSYVSATNAHTGTFNYLVSIMPRSTTWRLVGQRLKMEEPITIAAKHGNLDMIKTIIDRFEGGITPAIEVHSRVYFVLKTRWEDDMIDSLRLLMTYPHPLDWDDIMKTNQVYLRFLILSAVEKNQIQIFNELKKYLVFDPSFENRQHMYIKSAMKHDTWEFIQAMLDNAETPSWRRYLYGVLLSDAKNYNARNILKRLTDYRL
jgi:hypothetical protein